MWQRIVLWIVLGICLAHIGITPFMGRINRHFHGDYIDESPMASLKRNQDQGIDTIRLNFSWVCGTVCVIGLGLLKPTPPIA